MTSPAGSEACAGTAITRATPGCSTSCRYTSGASAAGTMSRRWITAPSNASRAPATAMARPGTKTRRSVSFRSALSEGAFGRDEDGDPSLLGHRPVVGVPVVVGAARRGEDLPEQQPEPLRVQPGCGSSGPASCGLPSTVAHCQPARNVGDMRADAEIASFDPAVRDEGDTCAPVGWLRTPALTSEDWMVASGPQGGHHDQAVVPWHERSGTRRGRSSSPYWSSISRRRTGPARRHGRGKVTAGRRA